MIFDGSTNDNGKLDSLSFKIGNKYSTIEVTYNNESNIIPIINNNVTAKIELESYIATKSSNKENHVYYPSHDEYGSLAFEDNWPYLGDFDFNDMVIDYNVDVKTNANGLVISATYKIIPRGVGAGYKNGFGFSFDKYCNNCNDYVTLSNIANVKRKIGNNNAVLQSEAGQVHPTYIIIDSSMSRHYNWNTIPNKPYVANDIITVTIELKANHSVEHFDFPFSNPFIYINGERGRELHLPYHKPTSLANPIYNTRGDAGLNYKSKNGLTWAIDIADKFAYPQEHVDILNAYLQFQQWATTPNSSLEWWEGTTNNNLIYDIR